MSDRFDGKITQTTHNDSSENEFLKSFPHFALLLDALPLPPERAILSLSSLGQFWALDVPQPDQLRPMNMTQKRGDCAEYDLPVREGRTVE